MDATEYDELVAWLRDEADKAEHPDGIDADAIAAALAKGQKPKGPLDGLS